MQYWWGAYVGGAALSGACLALPIDGVCRVGLALTLAAYAAWTLQRTPVALLCACSIAFAGSAAYATSAYATLDAHVEKATQRTSALVLADEARDRGTLLVLRLADGSRAECLSTQPEAAGSAVEVRGRFEPFDAPRNPGESDARILARARRVDGMLSGCAVVGATRVTVATAETARGILLDRANASFHALLAEPAASIAAGELWGERGTLSPELRDEFQESGTVHVLVTAGLHVGFVVAIVVWMFAALRAPRWCACAAGIAAAVALAWFSGAHLPAERAAIMCAMALAARALGRTSLSWNVVGIAVTLVLAIDPLQVLDASFWLSFCCIAAIFTVASPLQAWLGQRRLPHALVETVALSVATQLGTWPLTAAVFMRVNPYSIIANACIVPIVPITMAAAATAMIAQTVHLTPLSLLGARLVQWTILWTESVLRVVAILPHASMRVAAPPLWSVAAYEAALVGFPLFMRSGASLLAPALLVVASSMCIVPPQWPDGKLRVDMLDVGQADAILIRAPSGRTMLVDAGGRLERGPNGQSEAEAIGTRVVVPALLHLGVTHVDVCVITHPHGDHVAGFVAVLHDLGCGEILDGGQSYPGKSYHDVLALAAASRTPVVTIRDGAQLWLDPTVSLRFLGPDEPLIAGADAINDNSIAFILRYKSFRMLFTGDAGAAAEQRFLATGVDLRCDILKVGHHGSAHSSSPQFIAAVRPSVGLVSVGRHNTFGHPASQTLATLQQYGSSIFRTDTDGAVEIVTDGRGALPAISSMSFRTGIVPSGARSFRNSDLTENPTSLLGTQMLRP